MGRLLFVAALLVGCRTTGTFTCELDDHCRQGQLIGRCEPTRYCSFPDASCPSGSRYDDSAATGYAGTCVGDELVDAGTDSGSGAFDVANCPASYNLTVPSTTATSRYRVVLQVAPWKMQAVTCQADQQGTTHLVMVEMAQEAIELSIALASQTSNYYLAGAVQNPAATALGEGWILLDDTPVAATTWEGGDPDDDDDVEDAMEQFAMLARNVQRLNDEDGLTARPALCECDGKRHGPLATQYIANNP